MMDRLHFGFFKEFKGNASTLLFFGSGNALYALSDVLSKLNDKETIRLDLDSRFLPIGTTKVAISLTQEPRGGVSYLTPGRYAFRWEVTTKDVISFIEKIMTVANSANSCHHYLDGQLGDVTVVVSKGEYPETLYPAPPESLPARFQYFRERAGLSMEEMAEKAGLADMCVWDLEAYDDELFSVYSPWEIWRFTQILGITTSELMNLNSSEPAITAAELVQLINKECTRREISLDEFEDVVGWKLSKMLEPPELLLQKMSLDGITDLCKELHIDWVRVILGIQLGASLTQKVT